MKELKESKSFYPDYNDPAVRGGNAILSSLPFLLLFLLLSLLLLFPIFLLILISIFLNLHLLHSRSHRSSFFFSLLLSHLFCLYLTLFSTPLVLGMLVVDKGALRWPNPNPYSPPAGAPPPAPVVEAAKTEIGDDIRVLRFFCDEDLLSDSDSLSLCLSFCLSFLLNLDFILFLLTFALTALFICLCIFSYTFLHLSLPQSLSISLFHSCFILFSFSFCFF